MKNIAEAYEDLFDALYERYGSAFTLLVIAEAKVIGFNTPPIARPLDGGFDCTTCGHRHGPPALAHACVACHCDKVSP